MSLKEKRQAIWDYLAEKNVQLCAVTKGRTIQEVDGLLNDLPDLKIIGENRWPDCEEKFQHFSGLEKHFIGPLQSNKVRKVVSLVDVIQSVDSLALLERIDRVAGELDKSMKVYIQVNISDDSAKSGIDAEEIDQFLIAARDLNHTEVLGLMTIGKQTDDESKIEYFSALKKLQQKYDLKEVSMGMSSDYKLAIECGATIVRLGSCLF